MAYSAEDVKKLRDLTGAGMMDCKAALEAAKGEVEGAVEHLRKKGLADAAKKQHREARDGLIHAYIHQTGKMGVLIDVDCAPDFVARTPDFQQLVKDLAVQAAALPTPPYIPLQPVQVAVVEMEQVIDLMQLAAPTEPPLVIDKVTEGELEKSY